VKESDYEFPLPWHRLENRENFVAQLRREVGDGHRLTRQGVEAVAKCQACDDVLFKLADATYAMVHLGYPHDPTPHPDWVRKLFFDTFDDAVEYVEAHEPGFE
jgi:hypothetical protein